MKISCSIVTRGQARSDKRAARYAIETSPTLEASSPLLHVTMSRFMEAPLARPTQQPAHVAAITSVGKAQYRYIPLPDFSGNASRRRHFCGSA